MGLTRDLLTLQVFPCDDSVACVCLKHLRNVSNGRNRILEKAATACDCGNQPYTIPVSLHFQLEHSFGLILQ